MSLRAGACRIALSLRWTGWPGFLTPSTRSFRKLKLSWRMARMARNSVKYISYKDRKAMTAGLKEICLAPSSDAASGALERLAEKWGGKCPSISKSWRRRRSEAIPHMKFSPEIRKAIYTTDAIGSVNYTLQRNLKARQPFPNDEAAMKLVFMILRRISKRWTMPIRNWGEAPNQFSLVCGSRVPL